MRFQQPILVQGDRRLHQRSVRRRTVCIKPVELQHTQLIQKLSAHLIAFHSAPTFPSPTKKRKKEKKRRPTINKLPTTPTKEHWQQQSQLLLLLLRLLPQMRRKSRLTQSSHSLREDNQTLRNPK
jgi:hypothetical protein